MSIFPVTDKLYIYFFIFIKKLINCILGKIFWFYGTLIPWLRIKIHC